MKIGICIVDYGDPKLLENCLDSLSAYRDVDCSPNEYWCMQGNTQINIFDCNKENIGFSKANNKLVQTQLKDNNIDWIWLLNNDTTVEPSTLDNLLIQLPQYPKNIGVVGFKILSMDNPDLIHHAGTYDCFPAGVHKSGSVKLRQHEKQSFEKWVTFASVLIRREVFEQIGLLDPQMFNYFSDSDFCFRARYAGFKVAYEPCFVIKHKIGQSQSPSPAQMKILQRDSLVFQNKWINGKLFFDLDRELV